MRILFVADGRSPIAQSWIKYWLERGDDVFLASTFACEPLPGLREMRLTPVAFSGAKTGSQASSRSRGGIWGARALGLRTAIRQWLGPLTITRAARPLQGFIQQAQPQLVHALRIPYEGMLAAEAVAALDIPLVVSVWGNDFTLHAPSTPLMGHYTQWTMQVANALHADCLRDIRLAREWGFATGKPTLVTPGNGGIDANLFHPADSLATAPIVLNPRGFRAYVRTDTFFRAVPLVLQAHPGTRFLCASMAGDSYAEKMARDLGVQDAVEFLPGRPHQEMPELFQAAQVVVSPATHDGTPNTLLEAMACGCFPVAGDLASIREWIRPGENGLLVDPADPAALAQAILRGLNEPALRERAAGVNRAIIAERASYKVNMEKATVWYQSIAKN